MRGNQMSSVHSMRGYQMSSVHSMRGYKMSSVHSMRGYRMSSVHSMRGCQAYGRTESGANLSMKTYQYFQHRVLALPARVQILPACIKHKT
jgi:hypothetical protein